MKVTFKIKGLEVKYTESDKQYSGEQLSFINPSLTQGSINIEDMEVSTELTSDEFKDYAVLAVEAIKQIAKEL